MSIHKFAMSVAAATLVGAAATGVVPSQAAGATAPVSNARVLINYSLAAGERPENVTAVPGGDFYDTLSQAAPPNAPNGPVRRPWRWPVRATCE